MNDDERPDEEVPEEIGEDAAQEEAEGGRYYPAAPAPAAPPQRAARSSAPGERQRGLFESRLTSLAGEPGSIPDRGVLNRVKLFLKRRKRRPG